MLLVSERDPETHAEHLFGELAVRLYMTTRRDLDRALRAQAEARQAGSEPSLGEVMVGLELLTEPQVAAILKAQGTYDETNVETLYGGIALKNGFVTQADLEQALRVQQRTGRRLRIGEVLVKKGYLGWEQHESILRAQERILMGIERSQAQKRERVQLEPPTGAAPGAPAAAPETATGDARPGVGQPPAAQG